MKTKNIINPSREEVEKAKEEIAETLEQLICDDGDASEVNYIILHTCDSNDLMKFYYDASINDWCHLAANAMVNFAIKRCREPDIKIAFVWGDAADEFHSFVELGNTFGFDKWTVADILNYFK